MRRFADGGTPRTKRLRLAGERLSDRAERRVEIAVEGELEASAHDALASELSIALRGTAVRSARVPWAARRRPPLPTAERRRDAPRKLNCGGAPVELGSRGNVQPPSDAWRSRWQRDQRRRPCPHWSRRATLASLFLTVERHHDRVAVVERRRESGTDRTPDWRFHRHVMRLAIYLKERCGFKDGYRLALVAPLGPEWHAPRLRSGPPGRYDGGRRPCSPT